MHACSVCATNTVICYFRNNSGTSGQYEGDSVQNILGDLMSALFGWYVTALLHLAGYPWLVVIWTVISEAILLWYMRDCGLLICIQLICPIKVIIYIDFILDHFYY